MLPFYLLHEPVIVAAAWLIVRWRAPLPGKYAALVIVSFAATLCLYQSLVRPFRITRLLSGMKPPIKPSVAKDPEADGPADVAAWHAATTDRTPQLGSQHRADA